MGTVSEDFEVGIRNTLDSADRSGYGDLWYIMSGPGKTIAPVYNSLHSGDYLGELDDYFGK